MLGLLQSPSVPIPTLMPRSIMRCTGETPQPKKVVGPGTVRRRDTGPRQDLYVFLRDTGRQVGRDRLWGEKLYVLGVTDGRGTHPSPLVAAEDVGEAAGAVPYELDLFGALGEVYRQRPAHLPRAPRRQTRRLGIYGVRRMHADPCVHTFGQTSLQFAGLSDDELDGLLGGADLVREELGEDGPGHAALGELRQAFSVRRGLGHVRRPRLHSLPGRVAGGLGGPGLLLREAFYKLAEPARERAALGRCPCA